MSCRTPCITSFIEVQHAGGSATASLCYLYYDAEDDKFYETIKNTYNFANGSYFVSASQGGGIITNEEECPAPTEDTDYDPEFAYGAYVDETEEFLDEATPPTAGDAIGALVWEDSDADPVVPEDLIGFISEAWHGQAISVSVANEASASFGFASATASRVRFRYVRGYHAVDITLHWTDSAAVEGQLPIPLDGSWSAWLTASGEEEIVSAILKGGKYANP